jgi:hypothetical protein
MLRRTVFWRVAIVAILAHALDSPAASASEARWGSGYSPAYSGPPVVVGRPPAVVYPGPPVYAYSYLSSGDRGYSARHSYSGYYTARINVLRGPRWDYSAAYYSSPRVLRTAYGRHSRRGAVQRYCPRYRAYIRGPIVRVSRPW